MRRVASIGLILSAIVVCVTSCILDPDEQTKPNKRPPIAYEDLSERDHTLINLERAYNERNPLEYDRLLDDAFIFIFSPGDFAKGETPEEWDRASELVATGNMFDPTYRNDQVESVTKIDLSLTYPADSWVEEAPPSDPKYQNESWYTKELRYSMFIRTDGPIDFQSSDIRGQVTVRLADVSDESIWRIVRWRDDLDN